MDCNGKEITGTVYYGHILKIYEVTVYSITCHYRGAGDREVLEV